MVFPVQEQWRLSAGFRQMRPLSLPESQRYHIHAAWDIAAEQGTNFVAPENGRLQGFCAIRSSAKRGMGEIDLPLLEFDIAGHHYFYDVYGTTFFLHGVSGMTHVFAHQYLSGAWGSFPYWLYKESAKVERYPVMVWYSAVKTVEAGEVIGRIGSAGFSTGPHIHYEIHPGRRWRTYDERIDPGSIYPEF